MRIFISYSSHDANAVRPLIHTLQQAQEQVWFDEQLGGGDEWWRVILERIRDCDVFVVALSDNWIHSKACRSEFDYASGLNKPVLPAQVAPVPSLRTSPFGSMQVVDCRVITVESGVRLVAALHSLRSRAQPLPDVLPPEPPVPFAYLARAASSLDHHTQLTPQEQFMLVAELRSGLQEDGHDVAVRTDISHLLSALRDRPDIT